MLRDLQCLHCKHYRRGATCTAFPIKSRDKTGWMRAIPEEITSGKHDHRNPFPGDHGIQFEPKDD